MFPLLPSPRRWSVLACTSLLPLTALPALAGSTNVTFKADLALKESFDSNVYLQDTAPTNGVPGVVQPKQESMVTALTPRATLDYRPCTEFNLSLTYNPDFVFYHAEPSEDYFAHRAMANFGGRIGDVSYDASNLLVATDGNHLGPQFGAPGEIPAVGGIPLRDRRDATLYRGNLRVTWTNELFLVRPVVTAYRHDFRTEQHDARVAPYLGYENYIDRRDLNGGLDLGYRASPKAWLLLGYRYGRQDQYELLGVNSPYDSTYHRILAGVEGSPLPWLKAAVLAGPDLRDYASNPNPLFDDDELLWWIDASLTFTVSQQDTCLLACRRYQQPAFSSPSVYEDITYDFQWKHRFDEHFTLSGGFRIYLGDWQAPVNREDWIYTPNIALNVAIDAHLSGEVSYAYDWVDSKVPNTSGREYTRHLATVGLKYSF